MKKIIFMSLLALLPWISKAQTYIIIVNSTPSSGSVVYNYPQSEYTSPVQHRSFYNKGYNSNQWQPQYNMQENAPPSYSSRYAESNQQYQQVSYEEPRFSQGSENRYFNILNTIDRTTNTLSQITQLYQQFQDVRHQRRQQQPNINYR